MQNLEILIMVGTSGSGKSTFTKEWLKNHNNYIRINRDDIRKVLVQNLDGYYQRKDLQELEGVVTQVESNIFWRSAVKGFSVIVDNTNLTKDYIERWLQNVKDFNLKNTVGDIMDFKFKLIELEPALCKQRVIFRDNFMENQPEYMYDKMIEKVAYIDKQVAQFQSIKEYITNNFKDKIITE